MSKIYFALDADLTKLGIAYTTPSGEMKTKYIKPNPKEFHFKKDINRLMGFYEKAIREIIFDDKLSNSDIEFYFEQAAQANIKYLNVVNAFNKSELLGMYRSQFDARRIWVGDLDKLLNFTPYNKKGNQHKENFFVVNDISYMRSEQGDKYRKLAIRAFVETTLDTDLSDKKEDEVDAMFLLIYLLTKEKEDEV